MASLTVPPVPPNPRQDAMDLHAAFKGFGCDNEIVIDILTHRDATQRKLIQQEYKAVNFKKLSKRMKSELHGDFKDAMLLWILDPAGRDAYILKEAIDILNTRMATHIICSRTPTQLRIIRELYYANFGDTLEQAIHKLMCTQSDHEKLLNAVVGIPRYEGPEVDPQVALHDANELYHAGEKRIGTDEKKFLRIFTERSWAHIAAVSAAYQQTYGKPLEKALKKELSGSFLWGLLSILRCSENPAKYFAKVLRKSMKGLGTDEYTLTRVVVTRTEIDMQYIKSEYYKKYNKLLVEAIHSETSGSYRSCLVALVGTH